MTLTPAWTRILVTLGIVLAALPAAIPSISAIFHFSAGTSAAIASTVAGIITVVAILKEALSKPAAAIALKVRIVAPSKGNH